MGYSCTQKAYNTFTKVMTAAKKDDGIKQTNTWKSRGITYFCESPEEFANGKYFAQVLRMIGIGPTTGAVDCGYIEINPDGSVHNWPGLPKSFIEKIK